MSCWFATGLVSGNVIRNDEAYYHGGGIGCFVSSSATSSMTFVNNVIFKNRAKYGGGFYFSDDPVLTNNTLFDNTASLEGGGIWCDPKAPTYITNTILWNNGSPQGPEIYIDQNGDVPDVTYCNVHGGWTGTGNIDAAPVWADPAGGDFHLNWDSPCKDVGDPNAPGLPTEDGEGDPRIAGAGVDMGADEFFPHLYCRGGVSPGQTVTFHVVGEPGQSLRVAPGAKVLDPPHPTPHGDLFIWPLVASWPVGTVPGSGIRILPNVVPSGWSSGEVYPFQAQVGVWGNPDTLLTNLFTLSVE